MHVREPLTVTLEPNLLECRDDESTVSACMPGMVSREQCGGRHAVSGAGRYRSTKQTMAITLSTLDRGGTERAGRSTLPDDGSTAGPRLGSAARHGRRASRGFRGCFIGADQRTLSSSLACYPLPCAVTRTTVHSSKSSGMAAETPSTGA